MLQKEIYFSALTYKATVRVSQDMLTTTQLKQIEMEVDTSKFGKYILTQSSLPNLHAPGITHKQKTRRTIMMDNRGVRSNERRDSKETRKLVTVIYAMNTIQC